MNSGSVCDNVLSLFQNEFIRLCSSSNKTCFLSFDLRLFYRRYIAQTSLMRSSDFTVRRSSMAAYAS